MWLILVGLTLLTGDVLSQEANKNSDAETDLLAVPNEKLIHSRGEHLAVRDNEFYLPFGARLPGFEEPLFAYSYTVGRNTDIPKITEDKNGALSKGNKVGQNPFSRKVLKNVVKIGDSNSGEFAEMPTNLNAHNSELKTKITTAKTGNVVPGETIEDSSPVIFTSPTAQNKGRANSFGQNTLHTEAEIYFPPQHSFAGEDKTSSLHHPVQISQKFAQSSNQLDNLSVSEREFLRIHSPKNILTDTQFFEKSSQTSSFPDNLLLKGNEPQPQSHSLFILPSDKIFFQNSTHTSISLEILPPNEDQSQPKNVSLDYLPPDKLSHEVSAHSRLTSDYLPPTQDKSQIEVISSNFLSPNKSLFSPKLSQDYLPPKEKKTSTQRLSSDYLPPEEKSNIKNSIHAGLSIDYFPPNDANPDNLSVNYLPPDSPPTFPPKSTSIVPQEYLPPNEQKSQHQSLSLDYLPPDEEFSFKNSTHLGISLDYLPPSVDPSPEILSLDYLPPDKTPSSQSISPLQISLDYLQPKSKLQPQSLPLDYLPPDKISSSKIYTHSSISQDYLPPNAEKSPTDKLSLNYQSPDKTPSLMKSSPSTIALDYLPPKHEISHLQEPLSEYPPPDKILPSVKFHHPSISAKYISQKEDKSPPQNLHIAIDYLPPDTTYPNQKFSSSSITLDYLLPDKSYTQNLPQNYLPPNEISPFQKFHPLSVTADYLSPKRAESYHETTTFKGQLKTPSIYPIAIAHTVNEEGRENQRHPITQNKKLRPFVVVTEPVNQPIKPTADANNQSPFRVVGIAPNNMIIGPYDWERKSSNDFSSQAYYKKCPISTTCGQRTEIRSRPSTTVYSDVVSASSYDCSTNIECQDNEICQNGNCVLGCTITYHLCIGDARCETRQHVPACICPLMYVSRTVRRSGSVKVDCVPMMMSPNNIIHRSQTQLPSGYRPLPYNRPLVSPVRSSSAERPFVSTATRYPTTSSGGFRGDSDNPCSPSPCGPNTRCDSNSRGIALCRCIDEYVPDGNTINGCKPQCVSDGDCPNEHRCQSNKCARVCVPGACGLYANCDARNHQAFCSCPTGYAGNPESNCKLELPRVRAPPPDLPVDPCQPNPCGDSADCKTRGERAVCSCPRGYEGDPLTRCNRGECIEHDDCPNHMACQKLRCIDPCVGVCGNSAECNVRNHQPVCSCPRNHLGDPFISCRRMTEYDVCNPTPCGTNTNCKARSTEGSLRAVCSCVENYVGNPLTGCRPDCVRDTDCSQDQQCRENRCRNPCVDGCGEGAYCDVRNHRAVCTCPEFFQGDAQSRCYAECTAHDDCPAYQACSKFKCIDPCDGSCGTGADCKVENHTPICSCPRGYTGDPFISCRKFTLDDLCAQAECGTNADCTPGKDRSGNDRPVCTCPKGYIGNPLLSCQRGDCEDHKQCPDDQACYAYICQSPCFTTLGSVCGDNAVCRVRNHQPVCSCPGGYSGDPLASCRAGSGGGGTTSSSTGGRNYKYQSRQSYERY